MESDADVERLGDERSRRDFRLRRPRERDPARRTAMPEVASYSLLFYGSPTGYQTNRTQIQLSDANNKTLAWIRFNDPGMFFENDYESGGIIRMHLPSAMLHNVLDVLRNEKPIHIYFAAGKALLGTSSEPIGEEETST
jgi:hypothetical protein